MIPGSNLLNMAMGLIAPQTVKYFQALPRGAANSIGVLPSTFAAGVDVATGSLQPVPKALFQQLGLDYKKTYVTWYVQRSVIGLERDSSGDEIEWNGNRYKCQDENDWFGQDGWLAMLCVMIGPANA